MQMGQFETSPEQALDWYTNGISAALCTVVETWGSAPRRVGGQMAVSGNAEIHGSVSGGCVEGAVVVEALEAMENGQHRIVEYGVSDDDAFSVGLACGGTIRILIEPIADTGLPVSVLQELVTARAERRGVCYTVNIETGHRNILSEGSECTDRLRQDRSGFDQEGQTFFAVHNAPLRMIIVGAVHISQALVPMVRLVGFDPYVIDPRESFASETRFPDTYLTHDWPDDAIAELGLDFRTAVILLTHDPKLDDPALIQALKSEAFYVGALGSKKTHAKRRARLQDMGFADEVIDRIHGPIGLDIGASNPSEIAVSILSEVLHVLRRG